jgi:mRNA interferase MazF
MKRRPAVILSPDLYHSNRPDVIIGLITSQTSSAVGPTDYALHDWAAAGLRVPSAFRAFVVTVPRPPDTARIGSLSDTDWQEIQARVQAAVAACQSLAP